MKSKNPKALCRISIVNAEKPDEVLLDTLVKPEWPVTDYRSFVNGIKEEHLENVEFTLKHAQEFMTALCSDQTIVMGHSVCNDLAAIRMEHYCIVDSAYLFNLVDNETATPGLKDLCLAILKKPMPVTHDSVNDTRVALRCLEYYLEKDGNVEPVERAPRPARPTFPEKLFVHRIPSKVKKEDLMDVFLEHTSVRPEEVEDIKWSTDGNGKAEVTFLTAKHANLAFSTLEDIPIPEVTGRLQKRLFLCDGGYVQVRKMVKELHSRKSF